jgi:hypothetical protein
LNSQIDLIIKKVIHKRETLEDHLSGVDPINMAMDMKILGITEKEWIRVEITRKCHITQQTLIGHLHQNILGNSPKYVNQDSLEPSKKKSYGVDLHSADNRVFIELKNKWSTANSGSLATTRRKFKTLKETYPGCLCFMAHIITKKSNHKHPLFNSDRCFLDGHGVYHIDAKQVYSMVFGTATAFETVTGYIMKYLNCNVTKFVKDQQLNAYGC